MKEHECTFLLDALRNGDASARDKILSLLYADLHARAHLAMRAERPGHTLQTTALVHEAVLRIFLPATLRKLEDRAHVLSLATRAMRRVLVDHARARTTKKRGGRARRVPIDEMLDAFDHNQIDLLALDEALNDLAKIEQRQVDIVELRFFAGQSLQEIAKTLNLVDETVRLQLAAAKQWLHARLRKD